MSDAHPVDTDDPALIDRCRAGDVAAFEPLVEKYRERAWRLAFRVLRDREDARDVAQEAFIRAWQASPSFRGQSAFYTWLFRIVMNAAAARARQRAARGRAFGTERVPEEDWERVMIDPGMAPDERARRAGARARPARAGHVAGAPAHDYHVERSRGAVVPGDRGGARHSHGNRHRVGERRSRVSARSAG